MKKIFHSILFALNLIFLALLLFSYLAPILNPQSFIYASYLGLLFIYLVVINLFFVLMWILIPKWYFVFSLLGLLIGVKSINRELPYRFTSSKMETPGNFNVMSYNVRVFNRYNWNTSPELPEKMSDFFRSTNPDIICFQEFGVNNKQKKQNEASIKKMLSNWSYSYIQYGSTSNAYVKQGLAIFSKYPIIREATIQTDGEANYAVYCDIKAGDQVVRVFNCHLQSINLPNKESLFGKLLDSSIEQENVVEEVSVISGSLRVAYKSRAKQVRQISAYISASPYPVVVCGDFNDTPNSFAYRTMSTNLADAYMESGRGAGTTYNGGLPFLRIDYILYGKNLASNDFKRHKVLFSDHYPVSCSLAVVN